MKNKNRIRGVTKITNKRIKVRTMNRNNKITMVTNKNKGTGIMLHTKRNN
jgi:hypothetical protein